MTIPEDNKPVSPEEVQQFSAQIEHLEADLAKNQPFILEGTRIAQQFVDGETQAHQEEILFAQEAQAAMQELDEALGEK